jgi:hypothetical protein
MFLVFAFVAIAFYPSRFDTRVIRRVERGCITVAENDCKFRVKRALFGAFVE